MDLHNIREDYSKRELSEADCADNPIEQFERWLDEAVRAEVNEPTAVNVAAVDGRGIPNSRMVLLKEVNSEGFVFFTNYHSRKGRSLELNPFAAMTFFYRSWSVRCAWKGVSEGWRRSCRTNILRVARIRAVWVRGQARRARRFRTRRYWWQRRRRSDSNILCIVPRPPHWGGYIVIPDLIEFWQGILSRLHDRIQYRLLDGGWIRERLSP